MGRTSSVDETGGKADNGSGLPVAEGENAVDDESWDAGASLKLRLFRIIKSIPILDKDGTNEHFKYKYPTRNMIVYHAKEACQKHGVDWDFEQEDLTRDGNMISGWCSIAFYSLDDPEDKKFMRLFEAATDKGDKGPAKQASLAESHCLQKALKIVTKDEGDDPDKYTVEHEPEKSGSGQDTQEKMAMILGWATTMRTSIMNASAAKELVSLRNDCAAYFDSPDVPDTVKDEFRTLIREQRAKIKADAADDFEATE